MSMNPRETTDKIRRDYQEYIESILTVKDDSITSLASQAVRGTEFVKGPFLETTLPFEQGKSLKQLVDEGLLSSEFAKMGKAIHYEDWQLRIHQEMALRKSVGEKRNMIVSTGTGSGKTECYLYPVFNAIMREKEAGTLGPGVRALLIFPMNALANDQQKKLRKLLASYPDITFGRYTGETQHKSSRETPDEAEKRLHEQYDAEHFADTDEASRKSIPNEMMCREKMAEEPPHILLTNYAMLEYMLLQPDTAPFFDNDSASHWRFLVIDEAHTYKGATGTEIAFLLRRLKERIRQNMHEPFQCIATSATLGGDGSKESLAGFASQLFGEPFSETDVITTKRAKRVPPDDGHLFLPQEYRSLKERTAGMAEEDREKELYRELVHDLRLFSVYDALQKAPRQIEDVANVVFPDLPDEKQREAALIDLIELAAAAKPSANDAALLPARYHLFVKSLEGMFAQLYPQKAVFLDRRETNGDENARHPVFELANCQRCHQEYLVGKTNASDYFVHTSSMDKPEHYLISNFDISDEMDFDEDDEMDAEKVSSLSSLTKYHLCLSCGKITEYDKPCHGDCCGETSTSKIVTVYKLEHKGKSKESDCCPCCGTTQKGLIKRFLTANQPATFTVAKSLYDAIPPRPPVVETISTREPSGWDGIFCDDPDEQQSSEKIEQEVIDESGRKLLIFSDNRQEAAFFAGFFEKKYRLLMWRRLILKCLKEAHNNTLPIDDLIGRVQTAAEKAGLYQGSMSEMTSDEKTDMAGRYIMSEYIQSDISTALSGLGYVKFTPLHFSFPPDNSIAGLQGENIYNLLMFLMDTLRQKAACTFPNRINPSDEFFQPRNHAGYFKKSGSQSFAGKHIYGFLPDESRTNRRLAFMEKLCQAGTSSENENSEDARLALRNVFENTIPTLIKNRYIIQSTEGDAGTVYRINYKKWRATYISPQDTLYCCDKCGKVFHYSINSVCPEMKCTGTLQPVLAKDVRHVPYYEELYADTAIIPMVAKEHTAQLSSETAGNYQKEFEEGKINVLSCSTTFEMGVDVGELEATFQRNVPPETSNYIQRAGRAGRRTSSAAFSVTFARRNSHDMTFFQNPPQIISGKISPPILEITNEKIAQRHLNSVIVSWFFRQHPDFFTGNVNRILGNETATDMAVSLKKFLNSHSTDLLQSIHDALPKDICEALHVDSWAFIDDLCGDEGVLAKAIAERNHELDGLRQCKSTLSRPESTGRELDKAKAVDRLINTLQSERSINFLSAKGVLPKYGFPIDTVSLDVISENPDEAKKIDLSRDLRMAISEFAPPAEVVANGHVWKSYAINTAPDRSWPTYVYYECPGCKHILPPTRGVTDITADVNEAEPQICPCCQKQMNAKKFIVPMFGFSTNIHDKPKIVGETRPQSYYRTQTQFWGISDDITEKQKAEARAQTIDFGGNEIAAVYSPGGKLFILNQGSNDRGLFVCPTCGYACDPISLKGGKHKTKYDRLCPNTKFERVSLGHSFSTDVLCLTLPPHLLKIEATENMAGKDKYLSVLYAILEGASTALDISRNDISGCIYVISNKQELVLYDDTPGGSGFVKQIYYHLKEVLEAALQKVSGICGCSEETSCYGCLRNYANQYSHDRLSRGMAYEYIDWILHGIGSSSNPVIMPTAIPFFKAKAPDITPVEPIGAKTYDYSGSAPSFDTKEGLCKILEDSPSALNRLINCASTRSTEKVITDAPLTLREGNVYPEAFWPKAHVALFVPSEIDAFDKLKKYNWHCYMLDETLDAEKIVKLIEKKEM